MRMTAVFPERSTPVASAKTLGRPSKTKPTTPTPLTRCSTRQPSWGTVSCRASRRPGRSRHSRRPSIIFARIRSSATSRVVERPLARARWTSAALAAPIRPQTASSASAAAKAS